MPSPPLTPLAAAALRIAPAPERVLEVECGDGDGALFLAREFPAARVRGVDRSAELVRAATARVGLDPEGRVAFKQGRPGGLPYPDDFFDLVVAVDARPRVAEIVRVLRPGGHLILARARGAEPLEGLGGRLARWRLGRLGVETLESAGAGDGSFSVARLRGNEAGARRRIGCERMDIEGMPLTLLVNPASAGGKTLKLLPAVEQALDARRVVFRVQRTVHALPRPRREDDQHERPDRGGQPRVLRGLEGPDPGDEGVLGHDRPRGLAGGRGRRRSTSCSRASSARTEASPAADLELFFERRPQGFGRRRQRPPSPRGSRV